MTTRKPSDPRAVTALAAAVALLGVSLGVGVAPASAGNHASPEAATRGKEMVHRKLPGRRRAHPMVHRKLPGRRHQGRAMFTYQKNKLGPHGQ
jgi:hypothetical protein